MPLLTVPITEIRENPVALRAIDRDSEAFQGLVQSMKNQGFVGAITVREKHNDEENVDYYEVIDGLHRFGAALDAGLTEINIDVLSMSDAQMQEMQILANVHKIETKPVEYSRALRRLLSMNPMMSEGELAEKMGKSFKWIQDRLGLNKISNPTIIEAIDDGRIGLANAYALAKLPPEEMIAFVDEAIALAPDEFIPKVNDRAKEIREARRKGKDAAPKEFSPVAHMQKLKDIKQENETPNAIAVLIQKHGITDPLEAAKMAIKWVLHLDPDSVDMQKNEHEARQQKKEEARKAREAEKAKKKAAKAAESAAKAEEAAKEAEATLAAG